MADTARERPVLTVQLLDKQPRLTVSTIEDKRQALLAGLGVATMPYPMVGKDIAEGRLRVVSPESTSEIDIIMAWRRVCGKFPNFLAENNRLSTFYKVLNYYSCSSFGSGPKRFSPGVPAWQLKTMIISQPMNGIKNSSAHHAERSVSCRRRN